MNLSQLDRWEQSTHRLTQSDVEREVEHADEFHATFRTSSEQVYAILDRHAEKPFRFRCTKFHDSC